MRSAFLGIALAVLLAAPARADILAVAPVAAPGRADIDVGLIDASTGASLPLPAGVNTAADENHPSISTDGRRLAFERRDQGGLDRLIVADVSSLPRFGTVVVNPVRRTSIGLLVQRVVGHHRLLGRRVPKLRPAGRIPLGIFRRGRHEIHWRAHLRPGRYQFTPRAVTKTGRIRDLGRPRIFRVR